MYEVLHGDKVVGEASKSNWGKCYYLRLFGKTWQNAPGARYTTELDERSEYTACRSKKQIMERARENLT